MPDNVPAPEGKPNPTSPSTSGAGPGRTSLPPSTLKFKRHTGKVVVLLSSVAKAPPPRTTQALTGTPAPEPTAAHPTVEAPPPVNKVVSSPLPEATPLKPSTAQPSVSKFTPPPVPQGQTSSLKADLKGPGPRKASPIKLNLPPTTPGAPDSESIFAIEDEAPTKVNAPKTEPTTVKKDSIFEIDDTPPVTEESVPVGWKALEPGELLAFGDLESLNVFSNAQPTVETPPNPEVAPQIPPAKTPVPAFKPLEEAKAPAPPPLPIPAKPVSAVVPTPEFKPLDETKAPVRPPLLSPVKPAPKPPVPDFKPLAKGSATRPLPLPPKPDPNPPTSEFKPPEDEKSPVRRPLLSPPKLTPKPPTPDFKPLVRTRALAPRPLLSPPRPEAKPPTSDFKPAAPVAAKPFVHLPPVTPLAPVTTLQPAVVLSSPAPDVKKEGVRPPPLPQPKPMGITAPLVEPVKTPEPKEIASSLQVAPPLSAKAGVTPEAKLNQPHFPVADEKEETAPAETDMSASVSEPSTLRQVPALIKTEPPQGRKLPPPLPPREPAKTSPAVTEPITAKESTSAPLPEKTSSAVTGPILSKENKPIQARRPITLPARKVKLANVPLTFNTAKDEASSLIVTDPAGTKGPQTEPEAGSISPATTFKKLEPVEAKAPPLATKPTTPASAVTGPILGKETKPALRPPVLPSKVIREQELKKVSPVNEPTITPTPTEPSAVAKSGPPPLPAKIPESPKTKPSEEQPGKPTATITPVPLTIPAAAPVADTPAAPKKHRLPVKINRPPPAEPPRLAPPVVMASGIAMEAVSTLGLEQTKAVNLAPTAPAPVEAKSVKSTPPAKPPLASRAAEAPVETKPVKSAPPAKPPLASTRAARLKRKRLIGTIVFYILCLIFPFALLRIGTYFSHETRVEGQVIPPSGMLLGNEAWIVGDFHDMISTVTEDLAADRTPKLLDIQERLNHVQRAQADIQAREERIRLLQGQIDALKDEMNVTVKQARDASQAVWDGPGSDIDHEYDDRQAQLGRTIANRAKSLNLDYQPDPNFNSPEVWANAYRLALYQVPKNVDSVKEHLWLEDQMKQWRSFTKSLDDRKAELREKAAAIKQGPAAKVADLQAKIDDIQHRIDGTVSEEAPIKTELQQAQNDLTESQTEEAALDDKYYKELYALPESSITKRLPIEPNGRFSWRHVEKDAAFAEGEHVHNFWLFVRAARPDGRQYWALFPISVGKDSTLEINIEPSAFLSTKSMLRPDLSPDEQQQ